MAPAKVTRIFHHPRKTRTDKLILKPNLLNRQGSETECKLRRTQMRETFRWFDSQRDSRNLGSMPVVWAGMDVLLALAMNLFVQVIGDFSLEEDSDPPGFLESFRIAFSRPALQTEQELSFNVLLVIAAIFATVVIPIMAIVPSSGQQLPGRREFAIFVGVPSLMMASVLAFYLAWRATGAAAYGKIAVLLGTAIWISSSIARSSIWERVHASSFLNQKQQKAIHAKLASHSVGEIAALRKLSPHRFFFSSYGIRILATLGIPFVCAYRAAPEWWMLHLDVATLTVIVTASYLVTVVTSDGKRAATYAGFRVFSTSAALMLWAGFIWATVAAKEPMEPRFWVAWTALLFLIFSPLLLQMVDRTLWDARVWHLAAEYRLLCELQSEEWECYQRSVTKPTAVSDQLSIWSKPSWRVPGAFWSVIRRRSDPGQTTDDEE